MYQGRNSSDFRSKSRFEKPVFPFPRNPGNCFRRPNFPLRRRMMSGRYPNMGYRPFGPPMYRPNRPSMPRGASNGFRLRCPPPGTATQSVQRPPLPVAPVNNLYDSRTNQFSPTPTAATFNENQFTSESSEMRKLENMYPELWVEALAPGGRKYYYSARTRNSVWDRPMNGRVIDLDEINRIRHLPVQEHQQNQLNGNQNLFVHQQANTPCSNSIETRMCPMQPRIIIFPPPPAMYNPQTLSEHVQNTTVCFNPLIPPPALPYPIMSHNFYVNNGTVDCNTDIAFDEVNNDLDQVESQTFAYNEEFEHMESKISHWSVSESQASLCLPDNLEETENVSVKIEERAEEESATDADHSQMENESAPCFEDEDCQMKTEFVSSEHALKTEYQAQVDKSRPVSSTKVPGTCWSVVWTGDEKVFFFDSHNKISFWERPIELENRPDVEKLIEKPPVLPDSKSEKKEVRKTTFDGSEAVKKFKTGEENAENTTPEENSLVEVSKEKIDEKEESAKLDALPLERKVQIFCEMLAENNVSALSSWEKELHKIVYDSRYLLLSSKERKHVYEKFVSNKLEEDKKNRQREIRQQRENFICLLKEAGINSKSRFSDLAQRYGKDVRFKSIEKIKQKELLFNQYISELSKKEREKVKEQKKMFVKLLSEQKFLNKDSKWSHVQEHISNDERYKAIQNTSLKEKIFREYIQEKPSGCSHDNKEERISFSLKNREDEVKRDLSVHLKNRELEQEFHKRHSAISDFKALLNDLIRDPGISWNSAKKILKGDHRWNYVQCLESKEREDLFELHVESLNSKKKEEFHRMLDEIPKITLNSSWLDIRKLALNDPRCPRFSTNERKCEKEFKNYLCRKIQSARQNFRELLRETKCITHKSKSLLGDTNHLKDIEEILSKDQRYLQLDCMHRERKEIILSYIDKLHDEGPPAPPTASDPSRRLKIKK